MSDEAKIDKLLEEAEAAVNAPAGTPPIINLKQFISDLILAVRELHGDLQDLLGPNYETLRQQNDSLRINLGAAEQQNSELRRNLSTAASYMDCRLDDGERCHDCVTCLRKERDELRRELAHIELGAAGSDCNCRICGLRAELSDLKAALVEARGETYPQPKEGWRCFHCGEWFTTYSSARSHFGHSPDSLLKERDELRARLATAEEDRDKYKIPAEIAKGLAESLQEENRELRAKLERAKEALRDSRAFVRTANRSEAVTRTVGRVIDETLAAI